MGVVIGETAVVGDDCTIYQGVTFRWTSLTKGLNAIQLWKAGVIVGAGAKVLWWFYRLVLGAKIGPLGCYKAGSCRCPPPLAIPRISSSRQRRKLRVKQSFTFSAYGINPNGDDPISKAFKQLSEHVCAQQEEIERLRAAILRAGIVCENH